jgi:thiamine-phosphate pyrophosphorylase
MKIDKIGYYFITDSIITNVPVIEQVEKIVESNLGVRFIQYREKHKSASDMAKELKEVKSIMPKNIALIMNDRLDLALAYCDGVHLGDDDIPVENAIGIARNKLGWGEFVIGCSATSADIVRKFNNLPVDYIGLGPVYRTSTKEAAAPEIGIVGLKAGLSVAKHPVVAIGGINKDNLMYILAAKPQGISAISMVLKKDSMDLEQVRLIQKEYGLLHE